MYRIIIISAIFTSLCIYTGCSSAPSCISIAPPEIHLTGEKTVIENQIVGKYEKLEEDAWIISSVQTTVQKSKGTGMITGGDRKLISALKIRSFHKDDIRSFKDEGAVGETNNGFVKYRPIKKYINSPDEKKILNAVIETENSARASIFERSLLKSKGMPPSRQEIEKFGSTFAIEQAALAQKGDWIQQNSGKWIRKK